MPMHRASSWDMRHDASPMPIGPSLNDVRLRHWHGSCDARPKPVPGIHARHGLCSAGSSRANASGEGARSAGGRVPLRPANRSAAGRAAGLPPASRTAIVAYSYVRVVMCHGLPASRPSLDMLSFPRLPALHVRPLSGLMGRSPRAAGCVGGLRGPRRSAAPAPRAALRASCVVPPCLSAPAPVAAAPSPPPLGPPAAVAGALASGCSPLALWGPRSAVSSDPSPASARPAFARPSPPPLPLAASRFCSGDTSSYRPAPHPTEEPHHPPQHPRQDAQQHTGIHEQTEAKR